jgi:hypothetical protein
MRPGRANRQAEGDVVDPRGRPFLDEDLVPSAYNRTALCCCGTADRGVWTPTVQAAASHRGEVSCAVPPSEDIDLK